MLRQCGNIIATNNDCSRIYRPGSRNSIQCGRFSSSVTTNNGYEIPLFGKLCAGRKIAFAYTMISVIAGAVIYYIVIAFVLWLKMPSDDMKLFSAIVVAIFLSIPNLKSRFARKGVAK